jgi:hypothetical protein
MEFNVRIYRDPDELLDKVCMLAQDRVVVSGNCRRGSFSGMFDGSYRVDGDLVSIEIRNKPLFVSWSLVRKGLEFLAA